MQKYFLIQEQTGSLIIAMNQAMAMKKFIAKKVYLLKQILRVFHYDVKQEHFFLHKIWWL